MGNDYESRRTNKRLNKKAGREAAAKEDSRDKRQRVKGRPKIRRLCQGPCYKDPAISIDDVMWRESDDEAAEAWTRPSKEHIKADSAAVSMDGRSVKQAAKQMRLSTMADPTAVVASAAAAEKLAERRQKDHLAAAAAATADRPPAQPRIEEPPPVAFAALPPPLARFMGNHGFESPTTVQAKVWKAAAKLRDVLAVAQPGSGKTLAYLLSMAACLMREDPAEGTSAVAGSASDGGDTLPAPRGLVLVPTRELAQQVAAVARDLRAVSGSLRTTCIHGGAERAPQIAALGRRPALLVATPGRLLDLMDCSALSLSQVKVIALDEADKMLSLGFQPQLERLGAVLLSKAAGIAKSSSGSGKARKRPQVLLCTATMPEAVSGAAAAWLHNPVSCRIAGGGAGGFTTAISTTVTQVVQVCAEHKKARKLLKHLETVRSAASHRRNPPRCLVFTNRVKTAKFVAKTIGEAGHRVALLHGQRPQNEREVAMTDFRSGKASVLVATDVAGRGLHVASLPVVVNYDFPSNLDTYVHRVGRTGRLAADGHALSFFTRNMAPLASELLSLLQGHDQAVDPNLVRLSTAYQSAVAQLDGNHPQPVEDDSSDGEEAAMSTANGSRGATSGQPPSGPRGMQGGGLTSDHSRPVAPGAPEDLFEGLDRILSSPSDETEESRARERAAMAGGSGSRAEPSEGERNRHRSKEAAAAARKAPQLSSHVEWSKHEHKMPMEALAKGSDVSRNVSRRPIGAPTRQKGALSSHMSQSGTGSSGAAKAALEQQHQKSDEDPGRHPAGFPERLDPQAVPGSLEESQGEPCETAPAAGAALGGNRSKRRAGAIGGRLRKKLAKERAALSAGVPVAAVH